MKNKIILSISTILVFSANLVAEEETINAQCLIYYDVLSSGECKSYYQEMMSELEEANIKPSIEVLKDSGGNDMSTFENCLNTTCGKFPALGVSEELTYPYIMETVKGCKLLPKYTVAGSDLSNTNWLYNPSADDNNLSVDYSTSVVKTIPYKLLQYFCPTYSEEICIEKEKVTQAPVMCFKGELSGSLQSEIIDCMENKNRDTCNAINEINNIGGYVTWQYCDQDLDEDGYFESLSPEAQVACNRDDAASLRCERNSICTVKTVCEEEVEITTDGNQRVKCEDIGRNFEEHTINTACGDQTDLYKEDANCVRINSKSDALQEDDITLSFASASDEATNDYTEFVIYRKKENFVHDKYLAALFFPASQEETHSSRSSLGIGYTSLSNLGGGVNDWGDNGLEKILDDLFTITKTYCDETEDCEVKASQESKDWKWKEGGRLNRKDYTRIVTQTAIWTEPFVSNFILDDFVWQEQSNTHDRWKPIRIDYTMKVNLKPSDLLLIFNVNSEEGYESYSGTKINTYADISSCGEAATIPLNRYTDLLKSVPNTYAPNKGIHDIAMILPHDGIYTIEFFDGDTYLESAVKDFTLNDGDNYPITSADLLSTNFDYDQFLREATEQIRSKITNLVDVKIEDKDSFIDTIVSSVSNALIVSNQYMIDNNEHIDYYLEDRSLSLLYSLLEEQYFEEIVNGDNYSSMFSSNMIETNFLNFPDLIDEQAINQFEEIHIGNADEIIAESNSEEYEMSRLGNIEIYRTQQSFIDEVDRRYKALLKELNDNRIEELLRNVQAVYDDYQEVEELVKSNLNISATTYTTSTSYGSYSASFKSRCGDYQNAYATIENHYNDNQSLVGGRYFQSDLTLIRNEIRNIIVGHLEDITLKYKYFNNTRSGTTIYDDYHEQTTGSYSCGYASTCHSECAYTIDIDCSTTCNEDDECTTSCDTQCIPGNVDCTKTSSGSCNTYGSASIYPCQADCNGYVNAHWGSSANPSGDRESDVIDDQDNSCNGNYTWYTTSDNFGTGANKKIDGVATESFNSWGNYSCNDFVLTSSGSEQSTCVSSEHDQIDTYVNATPTDFFWESVAVKLNTSTESIDTESDSWMKENLYRDKDDISPYSALSGNDNVRYALATDSSNGINTITQEFINPIIKEKIIEIYKDYLTRYYNTLLDTEPTNTNADLASMATETFNQYYESYFADNWKPFNRIVIKDGEVNPASPLSVNYDITLPAGIHVSNPNSFSFALATHQEVRNYRCYSDWKNCDVPENCDYSSEDIKSFIKDDDKKHVNVLKDINYDCKVSGTVTTCQKLRTYKECTDFNLTRDNIAYDDEDFSEDFYEGMGQTIALNETVKLFGGQELSCEHGTFTDFSWAGDPMFLMQMAISAYGADIGGIQKYTEGVVSWASGTEAVTSTVETVDTVADTATTVSEVADTATTVSDVAEYADDLMLGVEVGVNAKAISDAYGDEPVVSVETNDCSDYFAECLIDLGFTPSSLLAGMYDDPNNEAFSEDKSVENFNNAEDICAQSTKSYSAPDGKDCMMWSNEYIKGKTALIEQNENALLWTEEADVGEAVVSGVSNVGVAALSAVNPIAGMVANVALKVFDSFEDCNQCNEAECATTQQPLEAIQLFKLTNGTNDSTKHEGSHYGLGSEFIAYSSCYFKQRDEVASALGHTTREADRFCCYNGQLTRILAGQIYQQFGYTFKENGCEALELEDLQRIEFSSCAPDTIPSPTHRCINYEEMKDFLASQVNWDLQKSFDTNTAVNTIVNATKNME